MWNKIKKWWAAFLATVLGIGGVVVAQTVNDELDWTAPTTRVNGTPMPAAEIKEYRVYMGSSPGGAKTLATTVTGLTATIARGANPFGTKCYHVTAVDQQNLESAPSGEACKTVNALPSAPGTLNVR